MFASTTGVNWEGFACIKHLVIFGDSYSSVGYDLVKTHPSIENPLGIAFPGITYTEGIDLLNWVGHLVRLRQEEAADPLIVYDYAIGGHKVSGINVQVTLRFLPHVGEKPDYAKWTEKDTLFITWVGINDCVFSLEHDQDLQEMFRLQDTLYDAGARNFMFIDVPPIYRSPSALSRATSSNSKAKLSNENWNDSLHLHAKMFNTKHTDATILMFTSWATFNAILDNPTDFGFAADDAMKREGGIWMDHLHPTSRVHEILANDILKFLKSFPAYSEKT